jgi:hypothetical protein
MGEEVEMSQKGLGDFTGGRYKITLEESWYHERPEVRQPDRRWYEQIPCRRGAFIALFAETPAVILHLYTTRVKNARLIFEQIKHISGVKADFHMDGEAVIYFPPELVHQVAELAAARKKKRLSPEHKENLTRAGINALAAYRLEAKKSNSTSEKKPQNLPQF